LRRMKWAGHVWGRREVHTGFWREGLREGVHLGDPDIDETIILRWIFRKWNWGY